MKHRCPPEIMRETGSDIVGMKSHIDSTVEIGAHSDTGEPARSLRGHQGAMKSVRTKTYTSKYILRLQTLDTKLCRCRRPYGFWKQVLRVSSVPSVHLPPLAVDVELSSNIYRFEADIESTYLRTNKHLASLFAEESNVLAVMTSRAFFSSSCRSRVPPCSSREESSVYFTSSLVVQRAERDFD